MHPGLRVLSRSVRESRYAVDERAVATAMLSRARTRLSADRAEVQKHLSWLERQIRQVHSYNGGSAAPAPACSLRRATRRASRRRANASSHQDDTKTRVTEYLARHPGSTAGDLATSLNLHPGSISMRLHQLANAGEIEKNSRGYRTIQHDATA
jgi:hypothetical protein